MPSHPLALPPTLSPDDLDAVTELSTILTRLRNTIQSTSSTGGLTVGLTGATPVTIGATPTLAGSPSGGFSLKDVPSATDGLKHKLQKARTQLRTLPDMNRTIAEQEVEMRELQDKIRRQREVLDTFRRAGMEFAAENGADTKMEL